MLKTYKYRIFPTKKQITILNSNLDECLLKYFKTGNAVFRSLTLEAPSFREGSIHIP